jgi:uncharacterized protein (DUF1499 family)
MSPLTILFFLPLLAILISCTTAPPAGELTEGHLRPCPNRPNCVTSDNPATGSIAPISFHGSPEEAWRKIQAAMADLGGTIKHSGPTYLWATFTSALFGFVDDVEVRMDPDRQLIHIRSGARVGYADFGVNRKRVEKIRNSFLNEEPKKDR